MNDKPDFEALRAERNARIEQHRKEIESEGWHVGACSFSDPNACYCACSEGGPCEHSWDGPPYESLDKLVWSTTCSRCGITSMSHSFRCGA